MVGKKFLWADKHIVRIIALTTSYVEFVVIEDGDNRIGNGARYGYNEPNRSQFLGSIKRLR